MSELIKYDAACRMLAEAVAVDEVQGIRNKAEAMRAYARQAKDRDLEISAAQIRFRAERRLGELIIAQKETVGLARGGRPRSDETSADAEQVSPPTLEQAGIDRKLSSRAQRMASIEPARFEQLLDRHREEVLDGNNKVSVDLMRTSAEADGRDRRRQLATALSDATAELPIGRRFPVLYADPPWRRKQGVTSRSYENHYSTMTWDEICALPVADLLLPDAWVFLWIPRAHMFALHAVDMEFADDDGRVITRKVKTPLAWAVARAWGCEDYSTAFIWTKTDDEHPEEHGGGVIAYDQDEVLLLFKRGAGLPKPDTCEKFGSNHRERSRPLGHSRKPEFYREMLRSMAGPSVPVLELFARVDAEHPLPADWHAWGNQAVVVDLTALEAAGHVDRLVGGEIVVDTFDSAPIDPAPDGDAARAAETMAAIAERVAAEPAPALSEFDALKAVSDFCFPNRDAVLPRIAPDLVARGLARRLGGRDDWLLSEAGWKCLHALEKARRDAAPDPEPEIVDGVLQCRLPLADHELEWQQALNAIDAGESVEGQAVHDLVGEGFVHVTTERLLVTDEGRAWLARLVDAPKSPKPPPPPNLPLFAAASGGGAT